MNQSQRQKQHHFIEIFSADCPVCKEVTDVIEIGKCLGCKQVVYNLNKITDKIRQKMKDYNVTAVPTTIIDGEIKVVGIPKFPWICGDDLYKKLKAEYPIN